MSSWRGWRGVVRAREAERRRGRRVVESIFGFRIEGCGRWVVWLMRWKGFYLVES